MTPPRFEGDVGRFGRWCLGPFLAGFSDWIEDRRRLLGPETCLLFVSRDGHLPKAIHDIRHPQGRAFHHYVLASRAAVAFAGLRSEADVIESLRTVPRSGTVRDALLYRFHLHDGDDAPPGPALAAVLADPCVDLPLGDPIAGAHLRDLVTAMSGDILERARRHHDAYRTRLREIVGDRLPIVVDIGYRGGTQRYFSECLERPVAGLYLVTHEAARRVAAEVGPVAGWDGDFLDGKASTSVVNEHRYVFEAILSAPAGAFLHFDAGGRPVHEPRSADAVSEAIRRRIHEGALAAAIAAAAGIEDRAADVVAIADFLTDPAPEDAALFRGLRFDDRFMGETGFPVVLPPEIRATSHALWIEGQAAVDRRDRPGAKPSLFRALLAEAEAVVLRWYLSKGHYTRYATNPALYLAQTTDPKLSFYRDLLRRCGISADPHGDPPTTTAPP